MSAPTLMAPAADTSPPARQARGRIAGATAAFWLFVGPFLVGLVIFVYLPIVWSVVLSFSRAQNTVAPGDLRTFVGKAARNSDRLPTKRLRR